MVLLPPSFPPDRGDVRGVEILIFQLKIRSSAKQSLNLGFVMSRPEVPAFRTRNISPRIWLKSGQVIFVQRITLVQNSIFPACIFWKKLTHPL